MMTQMIILLVLFLCHAAQMVRALYYMDDRNSNITYSSQNSSTPWTQYTLGAPNPVGLWNETM
jgi:hypothetical protein